MGKVETPPGKVVEVAGTSGWCGGTAGTLPTGGETSGTGGFVESLIRVSNVREELV
jgi:hypothetical protein